MPLGLRLLARRRDTTMTLGQVTEFDETAGYGTVKADDGRDLFFHCTQIADGSRRIDAGTRVRFEVGAGHLGRWEAYGVEPAAAETRSIEAR